MVKVAHLVRQLLRILKNLVFSVSVKVALPIVATLLGHLSPLAVLFPA